MRRIVRLVLMSLVALAAGALSLHLANGYIHSLTDDSAKATVAAGEITLFGVIFTAFYKEVDTYYSEKGVNIGKKWELIFPLLKKYYYPWSRLAGNLKDALDRIDLNAPSTDSVSRYLYLTMVFYGVHQRFVLDDGGLILLSSTGDEKAVEKAYSDLQIALDWAGDDTPRRVSYLQSLFIRKTSAPLGSPQLPPSANPYGLSDFRKDLLTDTVLQDDMTVLTKFMTGNTRYREVADNALSNFMTTFRQSMDRLYNAWSEA